MVIKTKYTSVLVAAVTSCRSFGMIWDEAHANVIAFYSPLWYHKEDGNPTEPPQDSAQKTPQDPAQDSAFNNNIIYNIYPPEDSRKGYSTGNEAQNPAETDAANTPPEIPSETPDGENISSTASPPRLPDTAIWNVLSKEWVGDIYFSIYTYGCAFSYGLPK